MKEEELIALGFEKCFGEPDEPDWYYFTYDFGNGGFSLITNASDELVDGKWVVEIFEESSIRFTKLADLVQLMTIINSNIVKEKQNI